jgi:hypothetical protein
MELLEFFVFLGSVESNLEESAAIDACIRVR